jgi:hypothetical protein
MHRFDSCLAIVKAIAGRCRSDSVQESVFVAKHHSGPNNGSAREGVLDRLLALGFGTVVGGPGEDIGVEVRDVDETRNTVEIRDVGQSTRAIDMHIGELEVPDCRESGSTQEYIRLGKTFRVLGLIVSSHEVVDNVRVTNAFLYRLLVS